MANLQAWDTQFEANNADYSKLYDEMVKANQDTPDNVQILSRLAKVTYMVSLNILEPKALKEKTQEVTVFGEKAIAIDPNHFQANLWLASAYGKLALIEDDLETKLKAFSSFLKYLGICVRLNAEDHIVLFMEGRMHLALLLLTAEEKVAIEKHLSSLTMTMPTVDLVAAETKLRKSIQMQPNAVDAYITLAYVLVKAKNYVGAREVIEKGLTVPRVTKSDEMLAKDMEHLMARLPPQ